MEIAVLWSLLISRPILPDDFADCCHRIFEYSWCSRGPLRSSDSHQGTRSFEFQPFKSSLKNPWKRSKSRSFTGTSEAICFADPIISCANSVTILTKNSQFTFELIWPRDWRLYGFHTRRWCFSLNEALQDDLRMIDEIHFIFKSRNIKN